jgi:protein farnesyltransferase subunit beta
MEESLIESKWYDEEGLSTNTSEEQCSCERYCATFLKPLYCFDPRSLQNLKDIGLANYDSDIRLMKSLHAQYLSNNLESLPQGFVTLDASRPWICYWITHSLYLLGKEGIEYYPRIISTLKHIQNKTGGYGGSPRQISQGAPNYAAVLTLCTIGTQEALDSIDRAAMYNWFLSIKHPSGGFCIHYDGEVDTRGTYTIVAIARILNILTDELVEGVADFVLSCQTYEGGFGGEPGNEAHGGYNFCAMATLLILKASHMANIKMLEHWLIHRQVRLEGGFQGRTNKLVDSCYSFWQGSAAAILEVMKLGGDDLFDIRKYFLSVERPKNIDCLQDNDVEIPDEQSTQVVTDFSGSLTFNQKALQRYILHCAQYTDGGGMRDKPGKARDFYHCCYSLSGLAVSQRSITCEIADENYENVRNAQLQRAAEADDIDEILPQVDLLWRGPQVISFSIPFLLIKYSSIAHVHKGIWRFR